MKKKLITISFFLVIFCVINVLLNTNVVANLKIEKITIDPESPSPLSLINFTVIMKNNTNYDEVRLILQECSEDLCF